MAGEQERLMGRNGELWRAYCRGTTQEALAAQYGLSQSAVSDAIRKVADSIPMQERQELIAQEVDHFRKMREEILDLWDAEPAPVTQRAGDGWDFVTVPGKRDEYVQDHTGRLNAARLALEYSKRMHALLGLDAAQRMDLGVSEEAAARLAAAEALVHLHGGSGEEEAKDDH